MRTILHVVFLFLLEIHNNSASELVVEAPEANKIGAVGAALLCTILCAVVLLDIVTLGAARYLGFLAEYVKGHLIYVLNTCKGRPQYERQEAYRSRDKT